MFRFAASIFTLLLTLSVVQAGAAQSSAEDVRKSLRDFEAKIDDGSATESDFQRIQSIYNAETNEIIRLTCTQLAAKYRRLIEKNPVKSLEILLPYLIGKERTTAWIKAIPPPTRTAAQPVGLPELPVAEAWLINEKTAHLAIEAAYALAMLDRADLGIGVANEVAKQFSDESRVLAAECIADIYLKEGRTVKSHEFLRYSAELLDKINKGQYAEKTARRFDRHDRDSVGRRVGRKFDLAVRLTEDERFGADWSLYRDARRFHKDGDLVSAYLIYMELVRDHSETIFADASRCHAIEILTLRAVKDSVPKRDPIMKQWQDEIAKAEKTLQFETPRNASSAVLEHYRSKITSYKRKLDDVTRIPEGPAALDMAENETEKFAERNPKSLYCAEAMHHVGLARLKINMDADKAEHWLHRAERCFHDVGSRFEVPEKVRNAAKHAAELRIRQDAYDFAELQSSEQISKLHGNTLLWLGVIAFSKKDYTQASANWKKRNEISEDSTDDSFSKHLTQKTAQGVDSPLARCSESLAAKNSQLHLAIHVADMYLNLGEYSEAERLFRGALSSKPVSSNKNALAFCAYGLAECGLNREGATKKNVDMLLEFAPGKKYADTSITKTALFRLADCMPQDHPMKEKVRKHVAQKYPEGNDIK